MVLNDGEKGVWRWGEKEIKNLSLRCHHQNDFCIKMGSDESHFNVSVGSDGQSHKTVSTNHNLFEEKGEPNEPRSFRLTARPNRLTTDDGSNKYLSFVAIVAGGPAVAADFVEGAGPTGVGCEGVTRLPTRCSFGSNPPRERSDILES